MDPLVVHELLAGSTRFSDISRGVPLMSQTLLSQRLKKLERGGIVERHGEGRRALEWHLTEAGKALGPLIPLAAHLASRMVELQGANAELLAIAAITPHMWMPELIPQILLPIIDAITVTDAEVRRRGITRVALRGD